MEKPGLFMLTATDVDASEEYGMELDCNPMLRQHLLIPLQPCEGEEGVWRVFSLLISDTGSDEVMRVSLLQSKYASILPLPAIVE